MAGELPERLALAGSEPHGLTTTWAASAQRRLREYGIIMAGRYTRWCFQGVTASIAEGLSLQV